MSIKNQQQNQEWAQIEFILVKSNANNYDKQYSVQLSHTEQFQRYEKDILNVQANQYNQSCYDYDIMGFPILASIVKQELSDEEPQQMQNQKQNETPKRTFITAPLKKLFTRSPLSDITPSIKKKLKLSCFNQNKINISKNLQQNAIFANPKKNIISHVKSLRI